MFIEYSCTRQMQPCENVSVIGSTVVQGIEELVENLQEKLHEKDKPDDLIHIYVVK